MYLQNDKYNVKRVCIFHLILDGILSILIFPVKNKGEEVGWDKILEVGGTKCIKRDESYLLTIPKKSAFSKSLIVMKCLKYLICVFLDTEYWTAKVWLKTRRKELPCHPLQGNGNNVNLSFYLNHCYTHISKQILEYIFSLNKYMEFWDAVLINQLTTAIFRQ